MKPLDKDYWLFNRYCAHRGLHSNPDVPENSLAAFSLAVERNYPIELDVHLSADGKLAVFHDDNLLRITGKDADVRDLNYNELSSLSLLGSNEKIPLLSDVLKLVNGKVPLLIEIKQQKQKGIEKALLESLKNYGGQFAVQSFDPFVLFNVKKLDKNVVIGILAGLEDNSNLNALKRHVVKHMSFNLFLQPDFINYRIESLPIRRLTNKKTPLICWTVKSENDLKKAQKYCVGGVFENILP